jgi:hypothetical protein
MGRIVSDLLFWQAILSLTERAKMGGEPDFGFRASDLPLTGNPRRL